MEQGPTCLDLDENQHGPMSADKVHFTPVRGPKVPVKNLVPNFAKVAGGGLFPELA
jgi:hypothetical protein